MTKKVYFVRHGQSEGNASPIFQTADSPLSEKGREQAQFIAERASHLSFEIIIASPLPRAKETAEIIAEKTKMPLEFSELFVERTKPTGLEGLQYGDPKAEKLNDGRKKELITSGCRITDAENYDDLIVRAKKALDYLSNRAEREILVATHGTFLRTIVACVMLGDTLTDKNFGHLQQRMKTENTGLTIMEYDKGMRGLPWRLLVWNDHTHLG